MIYSVPLTVKQFRGFYGGFMSSFYHDPNMAINNKCMAGDFELGIEWVLEYVYMPHNIVHFLDLFKLTNELILISENIVSSCGFREMFEGLT